MGWTPTPSPMPRVYRRGFDSHEPIPMASTEVNGFLDNKAKFEEQKRHLSHGQKTRKPGLTFPLYVGCLIGILISMVYEIIPI